MKIKFIALSLMLIASSSAETVSILVNIGATAKRLNSTSKRPGGEATVTTAEDFRVADPKISHVAPINRITGPSGTVWYLLKLANLIDSKGEEHYVELTGEESSATNAWKNSWNDSTPIIDSFLRSELQEPQKITIHGIKKATDVITLTVWGIGNNVGRHTVVTPSYGGTTLQGKATNFGSSRKKPTDTVPFVQFTFEADGTSDSISFEWVNPAGPSCLNGFAITYGQE